jgi:hypothetical protein
VRSRAPRIVSLDYARLVVKGDFPDTDQHHVQAQQRPRGSVLLIAIRIAHTLKADRN